jgi:CubicO group peptidase (beta-lactamase class C family)
MPHLKNCLKVLNVLLILALLYVGISSHPTQAKSGEVDPQIIDKFIQSQMQTARFPGLAVAIIQNGQVTLLKGYGTSSNGKAITPQSSFYIGSVSKSFTALAVMQLVERGKIDLDAPVRTYLPEFRLANEVDSQRLTIRHFLNQTSGFCGLGDSDPNQTAPSLQEQVKRFSTIQLSAAPGKKYCYNNQNYTLLGAVVEKVSGQSYGDYLQHAILTPLQMGKSGTNPDQLPELAKGYGQFFGFAFPREQHQFMGGLSAGYILSSVEDMTHYALMLMNGGDYQGQRLVAPETVKTLWSPRADINSEYGMGWHILEVQGEKVITHGGAIESYDAGISMLPDRKTAVIFLSNQNSFYQAYMGYPDFDYKLLNLVSQKDIRTQTTNERLELGLTETNKDILILVMSLLFVLDMILIVIRFLFLGKTSQWAQKKPKLITFLWAAADIIIPAIIFVLFFGSKTFLDIYPEDLIQFFPDLTFWFLLSSTLGLIRGLSKIFLLARAKSNPAPL